MSSDRPTLICLTPVKNEAWILERFLRCASLWADHIIVADQGSEDGSREIAAKFEKVTLIENTSPAYDEGARQRLLLAAARQLPCDGQRILIALDADEMLSANVMGSAEWDTILAAEPGTVLRFEWVNILPGFETCWIPTDEIAFGFVDDGSPHRGQAIHSTRVPAPPRAPVLRLQDVRVLHYQYVAWQRMASKQRWYQCWERLNDPGKRPIAIFRQYHGMHSRPPEQIFPFRTEWIDGYEQAGIDMRNVEAQPYDTWWDREILKWMDARGPEFFKKQAVWDVEWTAVARAAGFNGSSHKFADPRSRVDRVIHQWLHATQGRALEWKVRWVQRALRLAGW
jgi:glycosyltransferase involved in cell wall biosynthesis